MQFSEGDWIAPPALHDRLEIGNLIKDRERQKRDRDPADRDPGSGRIALPSDVLRRRSDDDQRNRKDSQTRETPQRRSENRTSFCPRQSLEERGSDQCPENNTPADPESEA